MSRAVPPLLALALTCASCSSKQAQPGSKDSTPGGTSGGTAGAMASGSPAAKPPPPASGALPSSSGAPSAAGSAPEPEGPPVCERSQEKVWGAGANKLTGLTTKAFGDKLAVGFAFGTDPRVLVVDKGGGAKLMKVKQAEKAKPPAPKEGFRLLWRVSPADVSGDEARAFVDYHDEFKDKRRHVSCGPADADDEFLEFEGVSWLDRDPKPTGDEKKKLFKGEGYSEVRDCRTFVSLQDKAVWALGSILTATEKPGGESEWKMTFVVDFGPKEDGILLHENTLKGDPPKRPPAFEVPVSRRIPGQGFLVATRYGSALLVALLDQSRHAKGGFKSYRGFPHMPSISTTDDDALVLVTGLGSGKDRGLRALSVSRKKPALPADFATLKLEPSGEDGEASFSAPELAADDKGRRWLVYTEGPHDKAHLRLAPLGADLQPNGRGFSLTSGDVHASEARLVALPGGKLLIVYLRDKDGKTELVSEHLSCEVRK